MPLRESSARRMALQCFNHSAGMRPEPICPDGACRSDGLAHCVGTDAVSAVVASKVDAAVIAVEGHDLWRVDAHSLQPSLRHDEHETPSWEVIDASEAVTAFDLGVIPLTQHIGTGRPAGRQERYCDFLVVHSSPRFSVRASAAAREAAWALV
jgi:hypothetical protein